MHLKPAAFSCFAGVFGEQALGDGLGIGHGLAHVDGIGLGLRCPGGQQASKAATPTM